MTFSGKFVIRKKKKKKHKKTKREKMEVADIAIAPLKEFMKDSVRLVKKCTKPDRREFTLIASKTAFGALYFILFSLSTNAALPPPRETPDRGLEFSPRCDARSSSSSSSHSSSSSSSFSSTTRGGFSFPRCADKVLFFTLQVSSCLGSSDSS